MGKPADFLTTNLITKLPLSGKIGLIEGSDY